MSLAQKRFQEKGSAVGLIGARGCGSIDLKSELGDWASSECVSSSGGRFVSLAQRRFRGKGSAVGLRGAKGCGGIDLKSELLLLAGSGRILGRGGGIMHFGLERSREETVWTSGLGVLVAGK